MGTNYYTEKSKPCITCGHGGDEWHIGKNSSGWLFLFASYPEEKLTSKQAWFDFLKDKEIKDEYRETIPFEDFWAMVEAEQSNPENWSAFTAPLRASGQPLYSRPDSYEYLDTEGYRFSKTHDFC